MNKAAPAEPSQDSAPHLSQAQLDQMFAPIALYPDDLLGEVVMAAGYPTEVVDADRWLEDTDHAALRGDELSAALDPMPWDPSVKSLVQFPQVLHMMDAQLDWTEALGEAFIADPSGRPVFSTDSCASSNSFSKCLAALLPRSALANWVL